MVQSNKDSLSAKDALAVYREDVITEIRALTKENKALSTSITRIETVLPYLATKSDIKDEFANAMEKHIDQYHKKNSSKTIPRPILTSDNYKKVVGSLIAVIAALVAVIYFLIGQTG